MASTCATPSDTVVSSAIEMITSMRLKPALLKLDLADCIDRHRLGFAVTRYRQGERGGNHLRHSAHNFVCGPIRGELNDGGGHGRARGQRAHRAVIVWPGHHIVVGR